MADKVWEVIKVQHCNHIDKDVSLEAEVVYPADILPDLAARVEAHRCSNALECNLEGRESCVWAGTNPAVDPLSETA